MGEEPRFTRGHRMDLLKDAISPLARHAFRPPQFERLAQALSLVFGVEVLIVLKDIWGLDGEATRQVAQWAASALVRAAAGRSFGEWLRRLQSSKSGSTRLCHALMQRQAKAKGRRYGRSTVR